MVRKHDPIASDRPTTHDPRPRARCFSVQATIVYKDQETWETYVATQYELVVSTNMTREQFENIISHIAEAGFQAKLKRGCFQGYQLNKIVEQRGPAGKFFETQQNDTELRGRRVFNHFLNINLALLTPMRVALSFAHGGVLPVSQCKPVCSDAFVLLGGLHARRATPLRYDE